MESSSPVDLQQIQKADVIIGVDEDFGNWFIIYGRDQLERLRSSIGVDASNIFLIRVGANTVPLEKLLTLVVQVKGEHEFLDEPTELDYWTETFLKVLHEGRE